jgi:hypothetical protein
MASKSAPKDKPNIKEFQAIQRPNTFTVDDAIHSMSEAASGAGH